MDLILVTTEEKDKVRNQFGVKEEDIKKNVKSIRDWIKTQQHLPKLDDEDFLERCLLRNKFRLDQTKQKIDGYCSLRGVHMNMFDSYKSVVPSKELTTTLPLPRLTPNLERVIVWKLKNSDHKDYDLTSIGKYNLLLFEILIRNDYAVGDRFIADFTGHTASSITRNNPIIISRFLSLYRGAYSGRFAGCDFINAPPVVNTLLTILKALIPAKFFSRIRVHKDAASLQKIVPKDCLPKDYGGDLDSVENLIGKWDKVFEYHQAIFEKNLKIISDEKLRPKKGLFGLGSNFKKLDID